MNLEQARSFLLREFPQNTCVVDHIGPGVATLRQQIGDQHLRPGGTVSGPTMMMLADCAAYVAILGKYGEVALAVTTSLNINFLRKPQARSDIIAQCSLLKAGKRLAVCEVSIYSVKIWQRRWHRTWHRTWPRVWISRLPMLPRPIPFHLSRYKIPVNADKSSVYIDLAQASLCKFYGSIEYR